MNSDDGVLPVDRFVWTLDIVHREGKQLCYSWQTIFASGEAIAPAWVAEVRAAPG